MPVTIDISKDFRYQQGREQEKIHLALRMIKKGAAILLVHQCSGIAVTKLEKFAENLKTK